MRRPASRLASGEFVVDWARYDFADIGCSQGGSILYCSRRFRAPAGIGVDIDTAKVEAARSKGLDAVDRDLHALPGFKAVRFVSMMQLLEHLADLAEVERMLGRASDLARDFLYIHHPSFEDEHYLLAQGLRLYYHHWSGHTAHVRVAELLAIFDRLGLTQYHIRPLQPIHDSSHPSILPYTAPINQHEYDESQHGPKPRLEFPYPIFQHMEIFVALRPLDSGEWRAIVRP